MTTSESTASVPPPLQAWLDELLPLLGLHDEVDIATVLDIARDAAHGIARPAGPLTTFAVGLAVGRSTAGGAEVGPELARLAAIAQDRALRGMDES
jgi:hypothetical protein